jgi:hypothetical protein
LRLINRVAEWNVKGEASVCCEIATNLMALVP